MVTTKEVILGGDMNCVLNPDLDRRGGSLRSPGSDSLAQLVADCLLLDAWRVIRDTELGFTWASRGVWSRLDRFYISAPLATVLDEVDVIPVGDGLHHVSDHSAVYMVLKHFSVTPRGRGLWKLNVSLLSDREVTGLVEKYLESQCGDEIVKDYEWWERLKREAGKLLREAGRERAQRRREVLNALYTKLSLLVRGSKHSPHPEVEEAIGRVKNQLFNLQKNQFDSFRVKAHCGYLNREEKHSRAFFRHYKERVAQTHLLGLRDPATDVIVHDANSILSLCRDHFENLYARHPVDKSRWPFFHSELPRVDEVMATQLEGELERNELEQCLRALKPGRAPGPDGLPVEFYRTFWHLLGRPFTQMVIFVRLWFASPLVW